MHPDDCSHDDPSDDEKPWEDFHPRNKQTTKWQNVTSAALRCHCQSIPQTVPAPKCHCPVLQRALMQILIPSMSLGRWDVCQFPLTSDQCVLMMTQLMSPTHQISHLPTTSMIPANMATQVTSTTSLAMWQTHATGEMTTLVADVQALVNTGSMVTHTGHKHTIHNHAPHSKLCPCPICLKAATDTNDSIIPEGCDFIRHLVHRWSRASRHT